MSTVNKVILIGHLGADPEIKRTASGAPVASLRLATSDHWRDKESGERKERTEWHRVAIFNETACKFAEQYLKKGAKVYVEGKLRTRKWQAQDGSDRYSTEIVIENFGGSLQSLDRVERAAPDQDAYGTTTTKDGDASSAPARKPALAGGKRDDMDDEIPF